MLLLLLGLVVVLQETNAVSYQQLRQKSSHNSYVENKEGLMDQLGYHLIRSLELDVYKDKSGQATHAKDWFVYHDSGDTGTTCNRLRDCLWALQSWHNQDPNHEVVTVWINFKDSSMPSSGDWGPAAFDEALEDYLPLYTPADLLQRAGSGVATLQDAVGTSPNGWPSHEELRGKFIFVMDIEDYADSDAEANVRSCFRVKTRFNGGQLHNDKYIIFFNNPCEGSDGDQCRNAYSANYVCRCWDSDDVDTSGEWNSAKGKDVAHIATDQINYHDDTWSKTHNSRGFPFEAMDGTNVAAIGPTANIIGISVDSGDIWGEHDDFTFAYQYISGNSEWQTCIYNTQSHVDEWAKAGLMVRHQIDNKYTGESSVNFAVIRAENEHKLRVQWRSSYKDDTNSHEGSIFSSGIDDGQQPCIKLIVQESNGRAEVKGYGSLDGQGWTHIKTYNFDRTMRYVGLAASSHNDGGNGNEKVKHLFYNVKKNGALQRASDFTLIKVGNDVSYNAIYDGVFQ